MKKLVKLTKDTVVPNVDTLIQAQQELDIAIKLFMAENENSIMSYTVLDLHDGSFIIRAYVEFTVEDQDDTREGVEERMPYSRTDYRNN